MAEMNLFVLLWQDSGLSNEIYLGSHALRRLIDNRVEFGTIAIPAAGSLSIEHDVYGYAVVLEQLRQVETALQDAKPASVFTLGGGCGIEVPIVGYLNQRYDDLEVFWFDAHGDINSPESSPSKYFHGMPLRFLTEKPTGNRISELVGRAVPHQRILLIGTRDLDDAERIYVKANAIEVLPPEECGIAAISEGKIQRNGTDHHAYVHIDLDCIDPKEFCNVKCPAKDGVSIDRICDLLATIRKTMKVVGISVLENTETDAKELKRLLPILDLALSA